MSSRDSADVFDSVAWAFDPAEDELTALASTERWFEHFPWEQDAPTAQAPSEPDRDDGARR